MRTNFQEIVNFTTAVAYSMLQTSHGIVRTDVSIPGMCNFTYGQVNFIMWFKVRLKSDMLRILPEMLSGISQNFTLLLCFFILLCVLLV